MSRIRHMPRALLVGLAVTTVVLAVALMSLVWTPHAVTGVIAARLHTKHNIPSWNRSFWS